MCKKIWVALVPAYEPTETLVELIGQLDDAEFNIVVIDDGSGEKYGDIFRAVRCCATVLTHVKNKGKGCALKTGLSYIKDHYPENTVIVTLDADGQHKVLDAVRVCQAAEKNANRLFLGSRSFGKNVPARSLFGNTITRFVYRLSTGTHVRDTQTGLRAFNTGMIPFMLNVNGERYEYEMNVLLECSRCGMPIEEIEIETVYYENNTASHFSTIKDSFLVYREIIKFAASSFTGFLVDYGLYSLLIVLTAGLGTAFSVPLSNVSARIVSAGVNYSINRHFVFKCKSGVVKTAAQYFALAAVILLGNTLLLSFLVDSLHVNKFAGKIFTEITFFTVSWLAQRYVIFRKHSKNAGDNAGDEKQLKKSVCSDEGKVQFSSDMPLRLAGNGPMHINTVKSKKIGRQL